MGLMKKAFVAVVIANALVAGDYISSANEVHNSGLDASNGRLVGSHTNLRKLFVNLQQSFPSVADTAGDIIIATTYPGAVLAGIVISNQYGHK